MAILHNMKSVVCKVLYELPERKAGLASANSRSAQMSVITAKPT
jgi:hypothetical protein